VTYAAECHQLTEIFHEVLSMPPPAIDEELVSSGLLDSMAIIALVVEIEEIQHPNTGRQPRPREFRNCARTRRYDPPNEEFSGSLVVPIRTDVLLTLGLMALTRSLCSSSMSQDRLRPTSETRPKALISTADRERPDELQLSASPPTPSPARKHHDTSGSLALCNPAGPPRTSSKGDAEPQTDRYALNDRHRRAVRAFRLELRARTTVRGALKSAATARVILPKSVRLRVARSRLKPGRPTPLPSLRRSPRPWSAALNNGLCVMRKIVVVATLMAVVPACGSARASRHTEVRIDRIDKFAMAVGYRAAPAYKPRKATVQVQVHPSTSSANSSKNSAASSSASSSLSNPVSTALSSDIADAPSGGVIHLSSGQYSQIQDSAHRTSWVTISGAGDPTPPTIDGAELLGAQYVRFVDVTFASELYVNKANADSITGSSDIQLLHSTVDCGSTTTSPVTTGMIVRGASSNVLVSGDIFEHCVIGFSSQAQDALSTNVQLTDDTFQDFTGAAIYLGGLDDVVVSHDVIRNILDPAGIWHNDGILFLGNVQNVDIVDNVICDSGRQLIFIQDAVAGTVSRVRSNTNILVAHNLLYGAGAVAIQDQAGVDVRFVGNTMWGNHFGSLWLLASPFTGLLPHGTIVTDNIVQGFEVIDGARPAIEDNNLIDGGPNAYDISSTGEVLIQPEAPLAGWKFGPGDLVATAPQFVSESIGEYQLASDSPALTAGTFHFSTGLAAQSDAPSDLLSYDVDGDPLRRPVAIGAFQPQAPIGSWGAPTNALAWSHDVS
jgi:hypothetical protein